MWHSNEHWLGKVLFDFIMQLLNLTDFYGIQINFKWESKWKKYGYLVEVFEVLLKTSFDYIRGHFLKKSFQKQLFGDEFTFKLNINRVENIE